MKFSDNFIRNFNKLKFSTEKHGPEILIGLGLAAFGATVYYTAKGTVAATEILSETSEELNGLSEECLEEKHTIQLSAAASLAKAYTPAVICGSIALASFLSSNHILRDRALSIAAAYTSLETGFSEYRKRVAEKYGDDAERELKYGIVSKNVKVTDVDPETGKKVKKTKTVNTIKNCSPFGVYFKPSYTVNKTGKEIKNLNWQNDPIYNITYLNAQLAWFSRKLERGERVYLSEVFKALGIPVDDYPDTRVVGWLPKNANAKNANANSKSDNYIRFNAYEPPHSRDYVLNNDGEVLLDFNIDGVILYK